MAQQSFNHTSVHCCHRRRLPLTLHQPSAPYAVRQANWNEIEMPIAGKHFPMSSDPSSYVGRCAMAKADFLCFALHTNASLHGFGCSFYCFANDFFCIFQK
jgi:hypothetical protein